jgi:P-type Ca2+ transporter type 2C
MHGGAAHALAPRDVAGTVQTDADSGLTVDEAARRLAQYGPNRPRLPRRPPYLRLAANQVPDPLVLLLVAATAVSIAIGKVGVEEGRRIGDNIEPFVVGALALVPVAVVEAARAVARRRRSTPACVNAPASTPVEVAR